MSYIAGIYEGAVRGYEQLIDTWFPALRPKMQIASTLPAQIVGSVNFTFNGVDISWFWEALPEGYQSGVDFYQGNCSFTENNSRYQTAWQQIHARRPQGLRYPSLKKLIIPLNVLRFQACPATEQAYQWLWEDLQRMNWVEGSLKDAGYPY